MPSNSSGKSKHITRLYESGSGGLNLNNPRQDDPPVDTFKERRWTLFERENRNKYANRDELRRAFNKHFDYE